MKKIILMRNAFRAAVAGSALLVSLVGGAAYAQVDVNASNDTTGPYSENLGIYEIDSHSNVDINSDGDVDNDQNIDVETGDNEIECNTSVEDFTTGDVSGDITISNELGRGDFVVAGANAGFDEMSIDLANEYTGPNSENKNIVEVDSDMDFDLSNDADIDNDLDVDINTGDNHIERNTVVGDISTGDIDFSASTENIANANLSDIAINGLIDEGNVSADFENSITGPNSENLNKLELDNNIDFDVDNNADIDNDTDIDANTGDNKIENNTCVGDISTGDVSIDVNTTNMAN